MQNKSDNNARIDSQYNEAKNMNYNRPQLMYWPYADAVHTSGQSRRIECQKKRNRTEKTRHKRVSDRIIMR